MCDLLRVDRSDILSAGLADSNSSRATVRVRCAVQEHVNSKQSHNKQSGVQEVNKTSSQSRVKKRARQANCPQLSLQYCNTKMVSSPSHLLKRAAIAQLCSGSSKFKNLMDIAKCAGWAQREGASMLFLPEGLGFLGNNAEETMRNAESEQIADQHQVAPNMDLEEWCKTLAQTFQFHAASINESSPSSTVEPISTLSTDEVKNENVSIIRGLRTIARESRLWISAGGIHIHQGAPPTPSSDLAVEAPLETSSHSPSQRVYNTHIIMNDEGRIVASYRKIHLFEVSIPSQNLRFKESSYTAPGDKLVVCSSPIGMLGLSTCFDVRFPELYSALRQAGADILLVPSAFTVPTGTAHWHTLLKARAIENQCYVLAAAQYGQHNEKRLSYGHSLSIDPWGKVISDAGGYDGLESNPHRIPTTPSITLCDIDDALILEVRDRMPLHRLNYSL